MDPLIPMFHAHGWSKDDESQELVFLKEEGSVVFGCCVGTGVVYPGDLTVSTTGSIIFSVDSDTSEDIVAARLDTLKTASLIFLEDHLFIRKMKPFWFPESKMLQLACVSIWTGHLSFLAAPYELFDASVEVPCRSQATLLTRLEHELLHTLRLPDDSPWANAAETYEQMLLPPDERGAANTNVPKGG